jgi:prepilin peptidase CpaA
MYLPFFPGPLFGWAFLTTLWAIMILASVIDYRSLIVPKWLTLTALPLGALFNAVRGGWLGSRGLTTFVLPEGGAFLGALDGLLFALAGFALAFALFFLLWILGVCGGGDVKLFAALGAWIGPTRTISVLCLTILVLVIFLVFQLALRLFRIDWKSMRLRTTSRQTGAKPKTPRRLIGFSLPLTVAVTVVLLWSFRVDLNFVAPMDVSTAKVEGHAK